MSRLNKLIAELCPDGVEYCELQELFEIRNGYTPSKNNREYWEDGTLPWYRMEDIRKNGRILVDSIQHITPKAVKGKLFSTNSLIIATTATIGEHALLKSESLANQQFTYLTRKEKYLKILDPNFVFYYGFVLSEWCKSNTNVSGFASVDMKKFKKFNFPVPPLPIQEEIVRILDRFTELETELETELDLRKKQYEYYRSTLLGMEDNDKTASFKRVPLEDVAYYSSKRINASEIDSENYIGVDNLLPNKRGRVSSNYVPTEGTLIEYLPNDILIGNIRPYLKKIWFATNNGGTNGDVLAIRVKTEVSSLLLPLYLFHVLSTDNFFNFDVQNSRGAKMPRGNKKSVMKYPIPLPPLSEQERIVNILDRFDKLTNDISVGLPAEIAARHKQYEYYRDTLLSFKEKVE